MSGRQTNSILYFYVPTKILIHPPSNAVFLKTLNVHITGGQKKKASLERGKKGGVKKSMFPLSLLFLVWVLLGVLQVMC